MKFVTFFLVIAGLLSSTEIEQLYLRVDWHPRYEQLLEDYSHVIYESGRVQLRKIKEGKKIPIPLVGVLRKVSAEDIAVYTYAPKNRANVRWEVLKVIREAKRSTFEGAVRSLVGFESRRANSIDQKTDSGNQQARDWIIRRLKSMGWQTSLHCYRERRHGSECNIVADLPGETGDVILVQAHFDDVGHANAGADDNASGSAGLLTMAEVMIQHRYKKTVRIMFTNGEENGVVGSRAYIRQQKERRELQKIKFTINMDMIGYNRNSLFEIETNREFEREARWMAELARTYTHLTPEITIPAWGSDHEPYLNQGIPSVLTIEDWQTKTPCYHRSCDKFETLNIDYAMEIVRLNLAAVAELAEVNM